VLGAGVAPGAAARAQTADDPAGSVARAISGGLPSNWHVSAGVQEQGVVQAWLTIPAGWRGNPVSAGLRACPDAESAAWNGVSLVRIVVVANGRVWPPLDCRQG
jgi:hypothetical protein